MSDDSDDVHVIQLSMIDGSRRRYLAGDVPEGDYLAARNVQSFRTSRETARRAFGLTEGKGQIIEPSIRLATATVASGSGLLELEQPDSSPPSAAPSEEEETMSSNAQLRAAIRELGAISRDPSHPDQHRAKRALREMYDSLDGKPSSRVAGASYESEHADELDRKMGLSNAGRGVRSEGTQLILSAAGRGQR